MAVLVPAAAAITMQCSILTTAMAPLILLPHLPPRRFHPIILKNTKQGGGPSIDHFPRRSFISSTIFA